MAAGDPVTSSDVTTLQDYTSSKPLFRAVPTSTQTLADNVLTALIFAGADDIDTHGIHDPVTNNTRVTPNVAGYYTCRGTLFQSSLVNGTTLAVQVRKNGTTSLAPAGRLGAAASHGVTTSGTPSTIANSQAFAVSTILLVSFNGTTDYVELMAQQDSNGSDDTNQSVQFSCAFELIFERPL